MKTTSKKSSSRGSELHRERTLSLLRRELVSIFDGELHDRDLEGVSLVRLELRGSTLTIWVASEAPGPRVLSALSRAQGFIGRELFESVEMKRFPELRFRVVGGTPDPFASTSRELS